MVMLDSTLVEKYPRENELEWTLIENSGWVTHEAIVPEGKLIRTCYWNMEKDEPYPQSINLIFIPKDIYSK